MNNKNIALLTGLFMLVVTSQCLADTKIGVGTGVVSGLPGNVGGQLVMPIKIGSHFMLEPFLGISISNEDADKNLPEYEETNSDYYQLGVGLYGVNGLVKDFEIYYGAAIGTAKEEDETKRSNNGGLSEFSSSYESTHYFFQPTLGISYVVNENFLLSIDLGLMYLWGEEDRFTDDTKVSTREYSDTRTSTRLLFRYLF